MSVRDCRMKKVKEESIVKLKREDVGLPTTFYSSPVVTNAAEIWKKKSVSIISPKSGRVIRQKAPKSSSSGFFSRLLKDFKRTKVSDFEYQQSRVRKNSSYKPFWATRVVEDTKTDAEVKDDIAVKKHATVAEKSNAVYTKGLVLHKDINGSPTIVIKNDDKPKNAGSSCKRLSTVVHSKENRTKPPPNYMGSKMFMPTGERLFWVRACLMFFLLPDPYRR